MMAWWLPAGLLAVIALAFLLLPFRGSRETGLDSAESRLDVYRDRLRELENDLVAGTLDPQRYEEAREELENAAALDLDDAKYTHPASVTSRWPTMLAVLVLVPLLALTMYTLLGEFPPGAAHTNGTGVDAHEDFGPLVDQLAARMQENPDDLEGWMLLGRSRMMLGDTEGALSAWREAYRLAGDDNATVLVNLGEALALTDPGWADEAGPLIERALELAPDNPKALFYGGMLALERNDVTAASARWRKLLELGSPEELREMIKQRLDSATGLSIEIGVSEALARKFQPGATLYVTARGVSEQGGPPLAAVRRESLGMLPARVTLSDANLMLPGRSLLDYEALALTARVTTGEGTERHPGDLLGEIVWQRSGDAMARIELDEVLE